MAKSPAEDMRARFGRRVRELRTARGLSQEAFADACGLHRTYIGGIERGERNLSLENIGKIAEALGVTLSELTALDGGPSGAPPAARQLPALESLSPDQFAWVESLVTALGNPLRAYRNPTSDIFTSDRLLGLFSLYLITHHTLSVQPFKQEKFEYALRQVMTAAGRAATLASRTNPGRDITVDGSGWSLKTVADKSVRRERIDLTKWMELGKGTWTNQVSELAAQCGRFVSHLGGYDRILVLRRLTPVSGIGIEYEVIEIPKPILLGASAGTFKLSTKSKQATTVPGTCTVSDNVGVMYQLYFDGGGERKLKLQHLRRDLCTCHATWEFETPDPSDLFSAGEE
jgi:transcriptional regulator with XRE-family HTH domain